MQKIMSHSAHKKFPAAFIAAVALLVVVLAATLSACNKKQPAAQNTAPVYDINMTYDSESHTISAKQETLFLPPENMKENFVLFRLYANGMCENNDAIDILSIKINRKSADFEICGNDNTLLKIYCSPSRELMSVALDYEVRLPNSPSRLGYGEECASLCFFYPSLAVYEDGWRADEFANIGDPFISECADFYVSLTMDASLKAAASGKIENVSVFEKDGKSYRTLELCAENIRDLGLVVGEFSVLSTTVRLPSKNVAASYFYLSDASPNDTLSRISSSIEKFSATFGEFPYPTFCVAECPLNGAGGMEYGAFATLSPASPDVYLDAATHETAHQWWYSAVGSDQLHDAWLDEGLSEFCTYYFYKLNGESSRYLSAMAKISAAYGDFASVMRPVGFDATMSRPLGAYASNGEYVAVTYQKGALLFDNIYSLVGEERFLAAMRRYYSSNKFSFASPVALSAAFKTQGFDITPILNGWINNKNK